METAKNVESSKSIAMRDNEGGGSRRVLNEIEIDEPLYTWNGTLHRLSRTTRQKKKNRRKKIKIKHQMTLGGQGRVGGRALIIIINNDIDGD